MDLICRLFLCASCRLQVLICSRCDRGHRYCSQDCSKAARRRSLQAANERYQKSHQGRLQHAKRMNRYRRYKNKVTYQGSAATPRNDLLTANSAQPGKPLLSARQTLTATAWRCHFCGVGCSTWVRNRFLDRRRGPIFVQLKQRGTRHGHSP